jgi:Flp pilus assembly protein TadB
VKWTYWSKAAKAIMSIGVVALLTAAFYRVRELLAALILFSFVFGVVILAMLILWLVGETTHKAAAVLESQMPQILPHAVATAPAHSHPMRRSHPWN